MTLLGWKPLANLCWLALAPGRIPPPGPLPPETRPLPEPLQTAINGLLGWFLWFIAACAVGALIYVGSSLGVAWRSGGQLALNNLWRVLWACVVVGNAAALATALVFLPDPNAALDTVMDLVADLLTFRLSYAP